MTLSPELKPEPYILSSFPIMHGPQGSHLCLNKKQSSSTKLVRCREWGLDHIGHQENVHVYKQQYFYCLIIYKDYNVYVLYDTVWDPGD